MVIEWTGLGPELLLQLDRDGADTLGAQLQSQLRDAVQTGRLAAGEKLPSTRALAAELGVSRGLVVECYAQLEAEGYLDSRSGSATRVSACAAGSPAGSASELAPSSQLLVDFRYGAADVGAFPMRDWLWALGEAAKESPYATLTNDEHAGIAQLREVAAAYVRRVRGTACEASNVVVTNGFGQGLDVVTSALAERGIGTVAVEDPGLLETGRVIARAGCRTVAVPVDERGLVVARLAATGARAVLVTPAHQCPTGVALAAERRQELIAWAHDCDGYVIEDDYDVEFRYDRQPIGSLQGLAPDRVFAITSMSKALAPGLRLGWVVAPPALVDDVARHKELADRGTSGFDQSALAHLIRSGRFDRHVRRMRAVYGARRDALLAAVAENAPQVRVSGLAAGFHAVFHLPDGVTETAVTAGARQRGVGLYGMSGFRDDGSTEPEQLLVGFGGVSDSAVRRGIETVADLLVGTPAGRNVR